LVALDDDLLPIALELGVDPGCLPRPLTAPCAEGARPTNARSQKDRTRSVEFDRDGKRQGMRARTERRLAGSGSRFIAIGAPLVVVGVVMALLLDGTAVGIGAAIAVLGAIPIVVGVGLLLSAGVEERARREKPFA
jgi:hypothetical protein